MSGDGLSVQWSRGLSGRELTVLRAVAGGASAVAAAGALFISPRTVQWHLRNIYLRLGATNLTGAVARARAVGYDVGGSPDAGAEEETPLYLSRADVDSLHRRLDTAEGELRAVRAVLGR